MRIGILARGKKNYATRRLVEAGHQLGHRMTLMDPFDCALYLAAGRSQIAHNGRSVDRLEVLIPRLSPQTAKYGLEVVSHFELAGVPCVNGSAALEVARHKWRSLRVLAEAGLPIPPTFTTGGSRFLDQAVKRIGGYPFIAKPFEGTQGTGILLMETPTTAKSAVDTLCALRQDYVFQEFYPEAAGRDVRALVVGDKVLGAMERIATNGEFRANMHRGGVGIAMPLSDELASLAAKAARAVGLDIAGVDILLTRDGPVVLEVNPSPGFEGFEQATHADVALEMMRFAVEFAETKRL